MLQNCLHASLQSLCLEFCSNLAHFLIQL